MKEDQKLKEQTAVATVNAQTDAMKQQDAQTMTHLADQAKLQEAQQAEQSALATANREQYDNLGQIVGDIQTRRAAAYQQDEQQNKRAKAFRYIAGVGDTLSSFANLIGTAHDASNQKQTYHSNEIAKKAEEARKARKIEMDDLTKRLDELTARQRDLKAAGTLKEAELKAKHDREVLQMAANQRKEAEEAKRYANNQAYQAARDARQDFNADRSFQAQQDQWNKSYNLQYAKFKDEKSKDNYNFTFKDQSYDIPKEKLTDSNVERLFMMIPEEIRKNIKGDQTTEYGVDEFGDSVRKTGYKQPSLAQKLAAIGAYAESNPTLMTELGRLAGKQTSGPKKKPNPMA